MALEEQYTEMPLNTGVDESSNKEGNVQGLLGLVNGEYDDTDSVRPRLGVEHLGTLTGFGGHALVSTPSAVGALTDSGVEAYVPGVGMISQAPVHSMRATSLGTSWNGARVLSSDSSTLNGLTFIAICELLEGFLDAVNSGTAPRRIAWRVVDNATWTTVASGTLLGTVTGAFYPRVVAMDANNFGLFWLEGTIGSAGGTTLKLFTWNTTTHVKSVTITVSTLTSTDSDRMGFDACDGGYFAFIHTAGNIKVGVAVAPASVTTLFNDTASTTNNGAVAICADTGRVVVGYLDTGAVKASAYPLALTSRLSNAVVFTSGGGTAYYALGVCSNISTGAACFVVEDGGNLRTAVSEYTNAGTVIADGTRLRTRPVTKPWNASSHGGIVCGLSPTNAYVTQTRTIVVVGIFDSSPWAQVATDEQGLLLKGTPLIGVAGGGTSGPYTLSVPVTEETGDAASMGGIAPPTGIEICRVRTVQLDGSSRVYPTARLLNVGFTGGSVPLVWDGQAVQPASFLVAPETPVLATFGTGLTGLYAYMVVFEKSDAQGNMQVSIPSQAATITLANQGSAITITVGALTTLPVRVKLYRTAAGASVFYLTRTFIATADVTTVTDAVLDVDLTNFEPIYSNANVLESEPAPAFTALVAHRNRLFAVRPDGVIAFSKETTDPFLPQWSVDLTFRVDNSGGPPRALASLDDKLIIFQDQTISGVNGQGPDNLGAGGFALPEPVAAGTGVDANNAQSVVSTPDGVMFRDSAGIMLLARNLQVSDVGLPVQRTLGAADVVAARYFPGRHQVWFFLDPATYVDQDTGAAAVSPPVLVFDVRYKRWSTFVGPWDALQDGVEVGGVVYLMSFAAPPGAPAGRLYRLGSAIDVPDLAQPGTEYSVVLKTAWFRGGKRNGTQRLRKMGLHGQQMRGVAHGTIQVDVFTQKSREQAKDPEVRDARYTFDATNFGALPTGGYSLHMRVASPRCSAFRCDVTLLPVGDGNGIQDVRLNAISYSYGTDGKTGKAPIGRKPVAS